MASPSSDVINSSTQDAPHSQKGKKRMQSISQKGKKRMQSILDAAITVLVAEGGEGYSMNKVADEARISLGDLQYYFPTKSTLIEGMLQNMLDEDMKKLEEAANRTDHDAQTRFSVLVDSLIESSSRIEDCKLVTYLWSVSLYSSELNAIHDNWYSKYRDLMKQIITELSPQRSETQQEYIAALIISIIEGSSLLSGAGRHRHPELKSYDSELRKTIFTLATASS